MPTDLLDLLGPPGWCSGCWPPTARAPSSAPESANNNPLKRTGDGAAGDLTIGRRGGDGARAPSSAPESANNNPLKRTGDGAAGDLTIVRDRR
jgi:hypothetical protein